MQDVPMSSSQSSRAAAIAQTGSGSKDAPTPWTGPRGSSPSSPYLKPPPSRGSRPSLKPSTEAAYARPASVERPATRQGAAEDGFRKGRLGRLMHTYGMAGASPARTASPSTNMLGRDGSSHLGLSPRSPWAAPGSSQGDRRASSREEALRGAVGGGSRASPGTHLVRKAASRVGTWAAGSDMYKDPLPRGRPSHGRPLLPGSGAAAGGYAWQGHGWHPAHTESDEHQLIMDDSDSDAHSCSSDSHGEVCHIPVIVTHGHVVLGTLGGPPHSSHDGHVDHTAIHADAMGWKHESMDGTSFDGQNGSHTGGVTGVTRRPSNVADAGHSSSDAIACYEDIPVFEQGMEYASSAHLAGGAAYESSEDNVYGGMTLDKFMARMQTTPASLAATSGLGHPDGQDEELFEDEVPQQVDVMPQLPGPGSPQFKHQMAPQQLVVPANAGLHGSPASPHSRHTKAALNNSFDLRPATACGPFMGNSSDFDDASGSGRFAHKDSHTMAPIKQVDLGGLCASLFTPNTQRPASGASSGSHKPPGTWGAMTEASPRLESLWGQYPEPARRNSGSSYHFQASGLLSPRLSGGLGSTTTAVGGSKPLQTRGSVNSILEARGALDSYVDHRQGLAEVKYSIGEVEAHANPLDVIPDGAAVPGTGVARQVQSARPQGARADIPIDPTVWRDYISVQLERPPSRQRPPPEALHLFNPLSHGRSGSQGLTDNPACPTMRMRPQSAAPSSGQSLRSSWGSAAPGGAWAQLGDVPRPPTRQKPPPMSVLMEHGDEFNMQPGAGQSSTAHGFQNIRTAW